MKMKLPDFEAWGIFAKVAEYGSFSRAAKALQLSPPTVSKAIGRLECTLGVALFHRNSRHVSLTEAGRSVLERAHRMFMEAELAESEVRGGRLHPSGLIKMTAPTSFGVKYVAPLLPHFLETYPHIELAVDFSDGLKDVISEGYDLALRIASLADSSLKARKICDVELLFVASPEYLNRLGGVTHPRDLQAVKGFLYSNGSTSSTIRLECKERNESYSLTQTARFQSNNGEAFLPALKAGLGFALLPDFMVSEALKAGELEVMLPQWRPQSIALYLVTSGTTLRPLRVNSLRDYLIKQFEHPSWHI